jgi:hypothetical protein
MSAAKTAMHNRYLRCRQCSRRVIVAPYLGTYPTTVRCDRCRSVQP